MQASAPVTRFSFASPPTQLSADALCHAALSLLPQWEPGSPAIAVTLTGAGGLGFEFGDLALPELDLPADVGEVGAGERAPGIGGERLTQCDGLLGGEPEGELGLGDGRVIPGMG